MRKKTTIENNHSDEFFDEFDLNDDEFFDQYEKPSRKNNKRSKEARRLIEKYWEDKELENNIDDYYFLTDD